MGKYLRKYLIKKNNFLFGSVENVCYPMKKRFDGDHFTKTIVPQRATRPAITFVIGSYVGAKNAWGMAASPKRSRNPPITPSRKAVMNRAVDFLRVVRKVTRCSGMLRYHAPMMMADAHANTHSAGSEISSQK
jgi:hypothetical protein